MTYKAHAEPSHPLRVPSPAQLQGWGALGDVELRTADIGFLCVVVNLNNGRPYIDKSTVCRRRWFPSLFGRVL